MQEVLTNRGKALQSGTLQQRVMAADMSVTDANSYNRASADYFRKIYGIAHLKIQLVFLHRFFLE